MITNDKIKIVLNFTANEIKNIVDNKSFIEIENIFKKIHPNRYPFHFDIENIIEKQYKAYHCFNLFYNISNGDLSYTRKCILTDNDKKYIEKHNHYYTLKFYSYKILLRKEKLKDI